MIKNINISKLKINALTSLALVYFFSNLMVRRRY
uniref:Uncharacterized protein n=1 Tax=Arundo donax TaxID=35708 RepID=A0A0A9AEA1_ARUDO